MYKWLVVLMLSCVQLFKFSNLQECKVQTDRKHLLL